MKTLAIVGAGPGLGFSLARKFGSQGFRVALIARNQPKLDSLVQQLKDLDIEAAGFEADLLEKAQITKAFAAIQAKFGPVDVLEFSPTPPFTSVASTLEVNQENALFQFRYNVLGALNSVEQVLPEMVQKGSGALLFTTGLSAVRPMAQMGNVGLATAGLRNHIHNLNRELAPKGIYAGHLSIGVWFQPGTDIPDRIADVWFEMYSKQDRVEELFLE